MGCGLSRKRPAKDETAGGKPSTPKKRQRGKKIDRTSQSSVTSARSKSDKSRQPLSVSSLGEPAPVKISFTTGSDELRASGTQRPETTSPRTAADTGASSGQPHSDVVQNPAEQSAERPGGLLVPGEATLDGSGRPPHKVSTSSPTPYISPSQRALARQESALRNAAVADLAAKADTGESISKDSGESGNRVKPRKKRKKERHLVGPVENRTCTNVGFVFVCAALIGFLAALTLSVFVLGDGSHLRIVRDSWGNQCGHMNSKILGVPYSGFDASDQKLLFFPNSSVFTEARGPGPDDVSFCVHDCPVQSLYTADDLMNFIKNGNALCGYNAFSDKEKAPSLEGSKKNGHEPDQFQYCPQLPSSIHTEYRDHCVPSVVLTGDTLWLHVLLARDTLKECLNDLHNAWLEGAIMASLAVVSSYILMLTMAFFHVYVVVFVCVVICIIAVATFVLLWILVNEIYLSSEESASPRHMVYGIALFKRIVGTGTPEELRQRFVTCAIVTTVLSVIMIILLRYIYALRRQFRQVGCLVAIGSRVLRRNSRLFLFPLATVFIQGFAASMHYQFFRFLVSLDGPAYDNSTQLTVTYHLPTVLRVCSYMYIAVYLWLVIFIIECQNFLAVYTTVNWYFQGAKNKQTGGPCTPTALTVLMRYHVGSVTLASLLLPIVWLPGRVLLFLQRVVHVPALKPLTRLTRLCTCPRGLLCCILCRQIVRRIHTYIEIVLYGEGFCRQSKHKGQAYEKLEGQKSTTDVETAATNPPQQKKSRTEDTSLLHDEGVSSSESAHRKRKRTTTKTSSQQEEDQDDPKRFRQEDKNTNSKKRLKEKNKNDSHQRKDESHQDVVADSKEPTEIYQNTTSKQSSQQTVEDTTTNEPKKASLSKTERKASNALDTQTAGDDQEETAAPEQSNRKVSEAKKSNLDVQLAGDDQKEKAAPEKSTRKKSEGSKSLRQQDKGVQHDPDVLSLFLCLTKIFTVPPVLLLGFFLLKDRSDVTFIWAPLSMAAFMSFIKAHCCLTLIDVVTRAACICHDQDLLYNPDPLRPDVLVKHTENP